MQPASPSPAQRSSCSSPRSRSRSGAAARSPTNPTTSPAAATIPDSRPRPPPLRKRATLTAGAPGPRTGAPRRLTPMARGTLRIYFGAAPGVGKTFAMLNEGRRRASRGTDLVVAVYESHGRHNTEEQLGDLEVIPSREVSYRGGVFKELDVDAVLARAPKVALVDEL